MPSEKKNILGFDQYMKPDKNPDMIYADLESLIKKIDGYANNSEKILSNKNRQKFNLNCMDI